jgi:NCAIR mutase (PurE)-related protein
MNVDAALDALRHLPYEDLGFAKIDHHRELRDLLPEVILALGKTPGEIAAIGESLVRRSGRLLVTRLDREGFRALQASVADAQYHERARIATVERGTRTLLPGVLVVCAGTSDLPVAQEAVITARMAGSDANCIADVGVAGIHRLLDHLDALRAANVLVVVAGMEGALPSVGGFGRDAHRGCALCPWCGFAGLAPLAMLNSRCRRLGCQHR